MTNCIFFPFSYISDYQKNTIGTFLSQCSYLSLDLNVKEPEIPRQDHDFMETIYLPSKEIKQVRQQVQSFHSWANLHKKNIKAFIDEKVWLCDPENTSGIISQIRNQQEQSSNSKITTPSYIEDLLLLELMRISDQTNQSIDDGLQEIERKQENLLAQLRGEITEASLSKRQQDNLQEPGSFMTEKRVFSWWNLATQKGLFQDKSNKTSSLILFTTSPEVYSFCTQEQTDMTNPLDINSIKVHEDKCPHKGQWQIDFLQYLQDILIGKDISRKKILEPCDNCSTTGYIQFQALSETQKFFLSQGKDELKKIEIGLCLIGLD